ncbi:hypothetical protein [Pseudoalteromonas rubra]|uniref:GapS1 family protein n=1 Tax=Pseudoalteromonas rubra TaxID=43658 RepID=UPI002DBEF8FA|nr:hypothetical protein [Pseudoalteromonas rubra]MEC4087190.1 hypothetical protein [Pseudoalteromonas rubra]
MSFSNKAARIRNSLKNYKKESIIRSEINRLARPVAEGFNEAHKMPWLSFLLIEWLFQIEESQNAVEASDADVNRILNNMYALQDDASNLADSVALELALRRMFLSQLPCQLPVLYHQFTLVRLYSLLIIKGKTPYFRDKFFEVTEIDLKHFIEVSLWLLMASLAQKGTVRYDQILKELYPAYDLKTIIITLKLLAGGLDKLQEVMSQTFTDKISSERYFASPQLLKVPFFKFSDSIGSMHQSISSKGVAEFVLEFFKANDHENFRKHFTRHFEEYVGKVIEEAEIPFIDEKRLKAIYKKSKKNGKVVDFLLTQGDENVFIDAKGIEPPEKVLMTDKPDIIRQRLKKSFSKGVEQSFECAGRLNDCEGISLCEREKRFVLVVTHQDFYILSGAYLKRNITDSFFDELVEAYGDHIPVENVHFCSIENFEGIIHICKEYDVKLSDFLRYCNQQDLDARTKKFDVRQHIQSFCASLGLDKTSPIGSGYLLERKDELFNSLIDGVKANREYWRANGTNAIPEFIYKYQELIEKLQ